MSYNPVPTRVWSRVQNPCTFTVPGSTYSESYIPLTGQTVSQAQANYEDKLLYKGNILQYKGNSSRLTKLQKYSQLAKGFGPNRQKVFATQSQTYTNPNTTGLLRVNFSTLPFPNQIVGAPNNISGPYQYGVSNPNGCLGASLQDGGSLVCGTLANPCTGQIIKSGATSSIICNPSSDSDVPGYSILCWDNKAQTLFPRSRYFMNNSGNKWPEGYKGLVSAARPDAPVLTLDNFTENSATISWTVVSNNCLPISGFNIYLNGRLYTKVSYQTTYNFTNLTCDNIIYVTSVSTDVESLPSNTVTSHNFGFNITGGTYTNDGTNYIITFTNNGTITICSSLLYPMSIILVGGGGGGAQGSSNVNDPKGGGGGGGAETIILTNIYDYSLGTTYNITIGVGGPGGTTDGPIINGTSSIVQFNSTYQALYGFSTTQASGTSGGGSQSNGGAGGLAHDNTNNGLGEDGLTASVTNEVSYGGGGGCGGGAFSDYQYSGGGSGGGVAYDFLNNTLQSGGFVGTAGYTSGGTGGSYYGGDGGNPGDGATGPTNPGKGENGQYGSGGGGGGGGGPYSNPFGNGGRGGNGFCIIKLPYIY